MQTGFRIREVSTLQVCNTMNANENCAYKLPLQAINYIILSYINFVEYITRAVICFKK